MTDPVAELRALAGQVSLLLAGIWLLVAGGAIASTVLGEAPPAPTWVPIIAAGPPFAHASVYAVRLLRATDPDTTRMLWRGGLLHAVVGATILIAGLVLASKVGEHGNLNFDAASVHYRFWRDGV